MPAYDWLELEQTEPHPNIFGCPDTKTKYTGVPKLSSPNGHSVVNGLPKNEEISHGLCRTYRYSYRGCVGGVFTQQKGDHDDMIRGHVPGGHPGIQSTPKLLNDIYLLKYTRFWIVQGSHTGDNPRP